MIFRGIAPSDAEFLEKIANEILKPIYGSQKKAMREWWTGSGFKHTFILEVKRGNDMERVGFLSLKDNPQKSYLKISTLVIVETKYRGCGYGVYLLKKAEDFAKKNGYSRIIVTVSEEKKEAISFFVRSGFFIIREILGKYRHGVKEVILKKIFK